MSMAASSFHALYLDVNPDPVFAIFHPARTQSSPGSAVLLCPPWGWDEVTSYRSRRAWADHLADAGHPTLRFDFPGSGDSGGSPGDPQRVDAWSESIMVAATWLRAFTGGSRIALVGLGLGGLLAGKAIAQGAPIDDLVLWATPPTGRSFIRGERAFSRFQDTRYSLTGESEPMLLPEGWMEAGGFVLSGETIEALEPLSLRAMATGGLRRALLLERDGIAVDEQVRKHLAEVGVVVTVAPGNGWGAMGMFVDRYEPPLEVFGRVTSWLADLPGSAAPAYGAPAVGGELAVSRQVVDFEVGTARVRESPMILERPFGRLFGLLAEPLEPPSAHTCAVFLNAGGVRRIGPNRIWVEASRRWAARGLPSLRIDLEGLGDSDGDARRYMDVGEYYVPGLVQQVVAFLDALEARGLGPRFLLVGLCAGGYQAFQAAALDPRVTSAVLLNSGALIWDRELVERRDVRKLYRLLDPVWWRRIVRGEIKTTRMREVAQAFAGRGWVAATRLVNRSTSSRLGHVPDPLEGTLDRLRDSGTRLVMAFSADEALHAELDEAGLLERLDCWSNIELASLPGRDHTVRPIVAQRAVHALLDREFAMELDRSSAVEGDVRMDSPVIS